MGSLIKSCSIGLADAAKLVVLLSRIDSQDKNSGSYPLYRYIGELRYGLFVYFPNSNRLPYPKEGSKIAKYSDKQQKSIIISLYF